MSAHESPKLIFKEEFDERLAFDVAQKGWCGIAMVELPEGDKMDVFFYSPARLAQDLETDAKNGHPYLAEPGLIVIPQVTLAYMETAVGQLYKQGYFGYFAHSGGTGGSKTK